MKNTCATSALAALVLLLVGCRSPSWYTDEWRGFPYGEAKEKLDQYRGVILVCVTADHGEQLEIEVAGTKRPGDYLHHYSGSVVRSFKGQCKVGDQLQFALGYCACGGKRVVTTNSYVGNLMFLLLDEDVGVAKTEFGIDPSETESYNPKTYRLFTSVFSESKSKRKAH